jgi:type I restriction enzyme, S subunit
VSFLRYPKYKDSAVMWLGEVPAHWLVCQIKRLTASITDGAHISPETENGLFPFVSTKDVVSDYIDFEGAFRTSRESFEYMERTNCCPVVGDVLLSKDGTIGRSLVVQDQRAFAVASSLIIVRPRKGALDSDYLNFLFQSACVIGQIEAVVKGAGLPRLSIQNLTRVFGCFPPLVEQLSIVSFLRREVAKLDTLIVQQRRLIELMREKRQAVILRAVTHGLYPHSPMRPSGVDWMGDVPAHWQISTVRRLAERVGTGRTPSADALCDEDDAVPWYTPGDFGSTLHLPAALRRVRQASVKSGEAQLFPGGSVLVVGIGATLGKVGYTRHSASANQQINGIVPGHGVDGYFLAYSLSVKAEVMRSLANASTIGIMNQDKTKEIPLAVPPLDEQIAITRCLDAETASVAALIAEAERTIDLLRERRTALISAAVTGKIDVRDLIDAEEVAA